jgi:hypothetical protein
VERLRHTYKKRVKLSIQVNIGGGDVFGSWAGGYTEEAASRLGLKSQTYQHPDTQMGVYCIFPRNGYNGCRESTQLFSINSDISNPKEEPMKRKFLFVTIGVVVMLLVAAFWAGKAFATTGCFTDTVGNFAETAICWMKDHGITSGYGGGLYGPNDYVTRAQMAVFMKNQAEVPPDTGAILITPGNGNWLKWHDTDDIAFTRNDSVTSVVKATTGETFISIQPSVPTVLYGNRMQLVGVDFCYNATASTYLAQVLLETFTSTTGGGSYTLGYSDVTQHTDSACRYYTLPAPLALTKYDGVNFWIKIHWSVAGMDFGITRTTFVLAPTDTMAAPFTDVVAPLTEMDTTVEVPGTTAP